jgi:hypothetical protein
MSMKQFKALVKTHGGWVENGQAHFPSVHQAHRFMDAAPQFDTRLYQSRAKSAE